MKEKCDICRFCLQKINDRRSRKIEHLLSETLNILCIKMDLEISKEPVICEDCSEKLWKAFDFKSTCVYTENCLVHFINLENDTKINLSEVYLKINGHGEVGGKSVCRFCMTMIVSDCGTSLNKIISDLQVMKELLHVYFSDMDLYAVSEPFVCEICFNSLRDYRNFAKSCVDVEEIIRKYIEEEEINRAKKIDLIYVEQFLGKLHIKEDVHVGVDENEIKQSYESMENIGFQTYLESKNSSERNDLQLNIKTEEIEIKSEEDSCERFQDTPFMDKDSLKEEKEEFVNANNKLNYNLVFPSTYTCSNENKKSSHGTRSKYVLKREILTYKNPLKVTASRYENKDASFETIYKNWLKAHTLISKNHSEPIYRTGLTQPTLIHKIPSTLPVIECKRENNSFNLRYKNSLTKHNVIHKNPSPLGMYRCNEENCSYETKRSNCFRLHMLRHKNPSEVTMHRCGNKNCSYITNYRENLEMHQLIHKNSSDLRVYICEEENCSFETKYKRYLKRHMLIHKSPSEVIMYRCGIKNCSYETKFKENLKKHVLIHKNPTEVIMYRCEIKNCSYETKYKAYLKCHMLIHKSPSEVIMYRCGIKNCSYETKFRQGLKRHMWTHKSPSEVTTCRCGNENCSYGTRQRFPKIPIQTLQ